MRYVNFIFSISGDEPLNVFNPFRDPVLLLNLLKHQKIIWFCNVYRRYRKTGMKWINKQIVCSDSKTTKTIKQCLWILSYCPCFRLQIGTCPLGTIIGKKYSSTKGKN